MPAGATLAEAQKAGKVVAYGSLLAIAISFTILAFGIVLMVKQMNPMKHAEPAAAPAASAAPPEGVLLREIRTAPKK